MKLTPTARNLLATVVVVGLLIATVGAAVFSAYTSVASSDNNTFTAGTIKLTANDRGSALFQVNGFTPGDSFVRCIQVDYASTGGVKSDVKLYGLTGGTGLAQYIDLKIRRGTQPPTTTSGDCTGFTADPVDYSGNGNGVIVDTTLDQFPQTHTNAVADPVSSWQNGDSAVYEITMTIQNDNAAQGLAATQNFAFEARNL